MLVMLFRIVQSDEYIIDIYNDEAEIPEDWVHVALKSLRCIAESERHD